MLVCVDVSVDFSMFVQILYPSTVFEHDVVRGERFSTTGLKWAARAKGRNAQRNIVPAETPPAHTR